MNLEQIYLESTNGIALFLLASMVIDLIVSLVTGLKAYKGKETLANYGVFALYLASRKLVWDGLFLSMMLACNAIAPVALSPESLWVWALAFVGVDFLYYIDHRIGHEVNAIWSFHSVHHSSEEYNIGVTGRISFIEGIYRWVFLAPLALVGVPAYMILLTKVVSRLYQVWVHTNLDRGKLEALSGILVTPGLHRVHHGSNEHYLDKNYGAIFSVWDRMFNTYQKPDVAPTYGLINPINTRNPLKINTVVLVKNIQETFRIKGFTEKIRFLLVKPGAFVEKTSSQLNMYTFSEEQTPKNKLSV